MGPFLRKTAIALLIVALFHVAAGFLADGSTDEYYLRFTTEKQRSMILGGSRAAQGLHPSVFNHLSEACTYDRHVYNFAFTIAHSPYGETYLAAIKEKLDPTTKNGLFILQVDPWLLSNPGDTTAATEADRTLGQQWTWNTNPNYEYLSRFWDRGWGALGHWPMGDPDTTSVLMPDGRLAVHVAMDPKTVERRTKNKVTNYRDDYLPGRIISTERLICLQQTIELLGSHGTVALVQLPVCVEIADMEHSFAPEFTTRMGELARATGTEFIDLDTMAVTFTDGNHLDEASGLRVTEAVWNTLLRGRP